MIKKAHYSTSEHPKTLLVAVHSPYNPVRDIDAYFDEFVHLVESNDIQFDAIHKVRLRSIDRATFFTEGKCTELIELCQKEGYEEIIISEPLTVQQERSLRSLLRCRIFDRTSLILEIFEKRATSAEGKIQVELARLQHKKSRVAGRGLFYSQQGGRIGTRGPGETQKEKDLQHLELLIHKLKRDLAQLEKTRNVQRKKRLINELPLICLIGYTNAGKSSILNALTNSTTLSENKLFSTLDTTTRELFINKKKIGLISDTVGFIQQLPHRLIEAFKSTLHELSYAHLLLHVIDASNPNWKAQMMIVNEIVAELQLTQPMVYVFNKMDALTPEQREALSLLLPTDHPVIFTSTHTEQGLDELRAFLMTWATHTQSKQQNH